MTPREPFAGRRSGSWLAQRCAAFADAGRGVVILLNTQAHARIHLAATLGVLVFGVWLDVSRADWLALVLAMALVWVSEAINTAIEAVVDLASPALHPLAGKAKDVAAGAVLLASLAALVIGVLVFAKYLPL